MEGWVISVTHQKEIKNRGRPSIESFQVIHREIPSRTLGSTGENPRAHLTDPEDRGEGRCRSVFFVKQRR